MREHNVSLQILGDQVPRLSLYDTSWTFRLKTLATSQFSKNTTRPQRLVASNLCVCAQNHSEVHSGHAEVVGLGGLEPPASPLSGVRSNHLSYRPVLSRAPDGGASRDRTDDPLLAKQVLSQLSYGPARDSLLDAGHLCGRLDGPSAVLWSLKEVIQPHLPIRLPCYDFTPVMNHTVVTVPCLRS